MTEIENPSVNKVKLLYETANQQAMSLFGKIYIAAQYIFIQMGVCIHSMVNIFL